MKRDYKLYLQDIRECIIQIESYLKEISEESFKKDKMVQDAVIRRLEIIGEACRNIPRALKDKNKDIPWFELAQFRDFVSHAYYEASVSRIWKTIKNRLPQLKILFQNIKLI